MQNIDHNSATYHFSRSFREYLTSPDYVSIILALDPHLKILLNGKTIRCEEKSVIITGAIREIQVLNNADAKHSYLAQINTVKCNIDLTNLYLNNIIVDYFDNYYLLDLKDERILYQIEGTLSEIENEYKNNELLTNRMISVITERFFIKFLRYYLKEKSKTKTEFQHHTIAEFIKLVNIHFKTRKKLKEYAELLYISPKTLSNLFLDSNSGSPSKMIKNRIIKEAKIMAINNPNISGKEVAFKLGYENPNNFFVLFRNKEKISFSDFCKERQMSNPHTSNYTL